MLFTLVIDVLNSVMRRATELGLLHRLTACHISSSVSVYADDVVVFCHPDAHDLQAIRELLRVFGIASGLRTNLAKCTATPIHCDVEHLDTIRCDIACSVTSFPMPYLGVPLAVRKLHSSSLDPLIEKLAKKLSSWRASMLSLADRLSLVRHVFTAMPSHILSMHSINRLWLGSACDPWFSLCWSHSSQWRPMQGELGTRMPPRRARWPWRP